MFLPNTINKWINGSKTKKNLTKFWNLFKVWKIFNCEISEIFLFVHILRCFGYNHFLNLFSLHWNTLLNTTYLWIRENENQKRMLQYWNLDYIILFVYEPLFVLQFTGSVVKSPPCCSISGGLILILQLVGLGLNNSKQMKCEYLPKYIYHAYKKQYGRTQVIISS